MKLRDIKTKIALKMADEAVKKAPGDRLPSDAKKAEEKQEKNKTRQTDRHTLTLSPFQISFHLSSFIYPASPQNPPHDTY
jgi:hypothetical protein